MTISRRDFIKITGSTVAAVCFGAAVTGGCTSGGISDIPSAPRGSYHMDNGKVIVTLSEVEALKDTGGAVKFTLYDDDWSERKFIVVHPIDGEYLAFADQCTHRGKELNYLHTEGKLACSGLRSQFDLAGNVVSPPAEIPLQRFELEIDREILIINLQGI